MMKRTFRLALLLGCCGSALAQPLYKWTEADGSITFSPEKPESGIDFQVIDPQQGVTKNQRPAVKPATARPDVLELNEITAMDTDSSPSSVIVRSEPPVNDSAIEKPEAILIDEESNTGKISYSFKSSVLPAATSASAINRQNANVANINAAGSSAGRQAALTSMIKQHNEQAFQYSPAAMTAIQQQNACEDLRKRIVSLEGRLKATLTPEDMDNTIMYMSGSQKSYDEYCVY